MQGVLLLLGICKRALRFGGFKIFNTGLSSFDIIISPNLILILLFHTNNMSELSVSVRQLLILFTVHHMLYYINLFYQRVMHYEVWLI